MNPTTFPPELAFTPIEPDRHVFLVLKPGVLPNAVFWGQCVGFDSIAITIRWLTIPIALVFPWNDIAVVLPLAPDWALQGDVKHERLLAMIADLWGQGKPLEGPALEAIKERYIKDIGPLPQEDLTREEVEQRRIRHPRDKRTTSWWSQRRKKQ